MDEHKIIFEEELAAWMDDPESWPSKMDYKLFTEWFQVIVSDIVLDLDNEPIISENY